MLNTIHRVTIVFTVCLCGLMLSACAAQSRSKETVNSKQTASSKSILAEKLKRLGGNVNNFIEGNLYFVGYHEVAHALISEFNLPVLGREEDAADRLAILLMMPDDDEQSPDYLLASMRGWFLSAEETPLKDIPWWDEHGTNQQRGYQIACLLYGADPKRFASIVKAVNMPKDRQESCVEEAAQNEKSWATVLEEHLHEDDQVSPVRSITVSYAKTSDYAQEQAYLKKIGLLEDLAKLMRENYRFKPGIRITAKECDEPNAFWNPADRELTICYELVEDLQRLAK